ncbi:MAG: hypothetical protein KDE00_03645 [Rhodobacteraceae bacterium]|nr:hypothetical protein [Paracoccaceae bacterium]
MPPARLIATLAVVILAAGATLLLGAALTRHLPGSLAPGLPILALCAAVLMRLAGRRS